MSNLRTGEVPCEGWRNCFRTVPKPDKYRDPRKDERPIVEVEIDCRCCYGSGYYSGRHDYDGPCRMCNATGLITVRGYEKR